MKYTPIILYFTALGAGHFLPFRRQSSPIDYNLAPPNLSSLANASLFTTWRPIAHVLPSFGQIGDPCMHYTSPQTGLFHVGYLHDGDGASSATTDNLVTYTDVNPDSAQFIRAGGKNDPIAVFDGSVIERGINNMPTLLYTSVNHLPIQWTIAHTDGSEAQSLAVETNGGSNFTKLDQGPVIPNSPPKLDVTGFRDPYVFQNSEFDKMSKRPDGTWYATISGGVRNEGPCMFLYAHRADSDAGFQTWEYAGKWWSAAMNSTWTEDGWAGRWGYNFEVGNVFALDERGANAGGEIFLTVGAEWSYKPIVPQVSDVKDMLWVAGKQTLVNGELKFEPTMAGKLDAGKSAYAAAGKLLLATSKPSMLSASPDRFITYIWLTGDYYGTSKFPKAQQNWTGSLLLPRELSVGYIEVIDNTLSREKGAWRIERDHGNGTLTLATLQQVIAREPLAAFKKANVATQAGGRKSKNEVLSDSPKSRHYMLSTTITFPSRSADIKAGLKILSGPHESTSIYYQFSNESMIVERCNSSAAAATTPGISTENEAGKFRLFDVVGSKDEKEIETLELTVVVDGGVVEVHVNNRFALSTWVWSWYEDSKGVEFLVEGGDVDFGEVKIWEGLVEAWPARKH